MCAPNPAQLPHHANTARDPHAKGGVHGGARAARGVGMSSGGASSSSTPSKRQRIEELLSELDSDEQQLQQLREQLGEAEDEKDQAERIGNDLAVNQLRPMKDAVNYVRACGSSSIPSAGSTSPAPLPAARRWTRS